MNRFILHIGCWLLLLTARAQPCPDYARLIREGNALMQSPKPQYRNALHKFNAARLCLPDSASQVDKRISILFAAIEHEKDEAIRLKKLADRATETAQTAQKAATEATMRAQALYWASESDKLPPTQAVRLLEQAGRYNLKAAPVYERIVRRFNESDSLPFYSADSSEDKLYYSSAGFTTEGSRILATSTDGVAVLWDRDGETVIEIGSFLTGVYLTVPLSDGCRILTISMSDTARVWDQTGKWLQTFTLRGFIKSATFSPNGDSLLTASTDSTARVWDLTGKLLLTLVHQSTVNSAVFSPNGSRILTGSNDKTAKVWDLEGHCLATLHHGATVVSAVFSPDGNRILTASSDDGLVKLWDLEGHQHGKLFIPGTVHTAVFSPGGNRILTASSDKTAKVWNLEGELLQVLPHQSAVLSAVFSPDGGQILTTISAFNDFDAAHHRNLLRVRLWNSEQNWLRTRYNQHTVNSVVFSPDGSRLLTTSRTYGDTMATVWDLAGKPLLTLPQRGKVYSAVFSPDGDRMLTTSSDSIVTVWTKNGRQLCTLPVSDLVYEAVFSPTDNRILTRSYNGKVTVWDQHGVPLYVLPQRFVKSASFSPDGNLILTTSSRGDTTIVWDRDGKLIRRSLALESLRFYNPRYWGIRTYHVNSAVFSHCGSQVIIASDSLVTSWRINLAFSWSPHFAFSSKLDIPGLVNSASFSPDSSQIITVTNHNAVTVWNLNGEQLYTLPIQGSVSSAVFSPDGNWIATDSNKVLWLTPEGALNWLRKNPGKVAPLSAEIREAYGVLVR